MIKDFNVSELHHLLDYCRKELKQYSTLEHDWDSYGGCKISYAAIEGINSLLYGIKFISIANKSLPDKLMPGPCSDGSVDLEVEKDNRLILINCDSKGRLSYYRDEKVESTGNKAMDTYLDTYVNKKEVNCVEEFEVLEEVDWVLQGEYHR